MIQMSKALYACPVCKEDFTRKSSALRHMNNMHEGRCPLVRYIDYIAERQSGQYPPPLTPSRVLGRKNKTVADNSRGEISYANGFETNNSSEHLTAPPTSTNPLRNPVFEALNNLIDDEKIYSRLRPGINIYTLPMDISIAKPSWLRAFICDLCLSVPIDAMGYWILNES